MKNLLPEILEMLGLLLQAAFAKGKIVWIKGQQLTRKYVRMLLMIATCWIFLPLLIATIGVLGGWRWIVSTAGLISMVSLCFLTAGATPIGVLIDSILPSEEEKKKILLIFPVSGGRYLKLMLGIMVWQSLMFIFFSVVPVRNNLAGVPTFLLGTAFLIISGIYWGYPDKWFQDASRWTVGVIMILYTISFYVPTLTVEVAATKIWAHASGWLTSLDYWTIRLVAIAVIAAAIYGIKKISGNVHPNEAPGTDHGHGGGHGGGGHGHHGLFSWQSFQWVVGILLIVAFLAYGVIGRRALFDSPRMETGINPEKLLLVEVAKVTRIEALLGVNRMPEIMDPTAVVYISKDDGPWVPVAKNSGGNTNICTNFVLGNFRHLDVKAKDREVLVKVHQW
jgi:hypothetical protein